MTHKIFVYGTLLRSEANAHVMQSAKLLGEGTVPGTLYGFGFAPGAVHPKRQEHVASSVVHGELYEVDDDLLEELDCLENEPINYTRLPVGVCLIKPTRALSFESDSSLVYFDGVEEDGYTESRLGWTTSARVYYYNHPVDGGELIASGRWRDRTRRVEVYR